MFTFRTFLYFFLLFCKKVEKVTPSTFFFTCQVREKK
jgi:hypothetical protein